LTSPKFFIKCQHRTGFDECPKSCNSHCYNHVVRAYTENQAILLRNTHIAYNEMHVVEIVRLE